MSQKQFIHTCYSTIDVISSLDQELILLLYCKQIQLSLFNNTKYIPCIYAQKCDNIMHYQQHKIDIDIRKLVYELFFTCLLSYRPITFSMYIYMIFLDYFNISNHDSLPN